MINQSTDEGPKKRDKDEENDEPIPVIPGEEPPAPIRDPPDETKSPIDEGPKGPKKIADQPTN